MTTQPPTWQQPVEPPGPAPGVRFSGHGARLGAYIVDSIIIGVVVTAAAVLLAVVFFGTLDFTISENGDVTFDDTGAAAASAGLYALAMLVIGLLALLYFPFFWARGGQTPGMRVGGIRVVNDRDGSRIGWGAAFLRLIGYWISAAVFYIGFAWILVDKRRRGWHDLIAGTCVIEAR